MNFTRTIVLSLGLAAVAATAEAQQPARVFIAAMTPSQEIANPSIGEATPSCLATFETAGPRLLRYTIRCTNITGVTAAHIHAPASADTEADPVVVLFENAGTDEVNGTLRRGRIRSGIDLSEEDFAELLDQMRNDNAYVNVHTTINPGGEVRGQVTAVLLQRQFVLDIF